jgi:hypothetical protein
LLFAEFIANWGESDSAIPQSVCVLIQPKLDGGSGVVRLVGRTVPKSLCHRRSTRPDSVVGGVHVRGLAPKSGGRTQDCSVNAVLVVAFEDAIPLLLSSVIVGESVSEADIDVVFIIEADDDWVWSIADALYEIARAAPPVKHVLILNGKVRILVGPVHHSLVRVLSKVSLLLLAVVDL